MKSSEAKEMSAIVKVLPAKKGDFLRLLSSSFNRDLQSFEA